MRLWHKIFICTLVLVIAAVDITAALLLSRSYETMLEREKQRAVTEHGYLLATLRSQVLYRRVAGGRILLTEEEILEIAGGITLAARTMTWRCTVTDSGFPALFPARRKRRRAYLAVMRRRKNPGCG